LATVLIEACIDSIGDALDAQAAGARRVELCADLTEGGTTPSVGLIRAVVAHVDIPVFVMIRPRGGDFLYSAGEIDVMLRDIEAARASGAHGIVSGALHANGTIDQEGTEALLEAAAPLPFTFHRAFDMTRDLDESLDVLMAIGASRVLTSGGAATALAGVPVLSRLCIRAGDRLVIIAGGGVRSPHIAAIAQETGVREFHIGARKLVQTRMRYRPSAPRVNKQASIEEGEWFETDSAELAAAVAALRGR
jgi:copper homeostasis protein